MDIVLCATQRCGSTLIVEDMRNTSVLGKPEEWFVPWDPEKEGVNWGEALASVERRATGENGKSAIKVMANQLFPVESCLTGVVSPRDSGEFPHFAAAFEGAQWVWLKRRDVVSQAISRIMAMQTGINHATGKAEDDHFAGNLAKGYDPNYNAGAVYRYGAILRQVTAITLENLAWQRFFESQKITPVEMVYEEVIRDDDMGHLDVFAGMVGLTDRPERKPRAMVKVGNQKNKNWRERFFQDAAKNNYMPAKPQPA